MRRELELAKEETSGVRMYLLAGYYLMARNTLWTIVGIGVVFILIGIATSNALGPTITQNESAKSITGMFGVWGATLIVFGVLSYVVLWIIKIRSQRRSTTN